MAAPGKKFGAAILLLTGMLLAIPGGVDAETRTVSWAAVTAYTDGTPIEPTRTVRYDIFWTQDSGLSSASLRAVASSTTLTSATFDPGVLGMPRGQTIYFTGDVVLNTGEKSALASPYSWTVPPVSPPPPPTLTSLTISGPSSVNEGATGTYTATATWSDGSSTGVTPTWSVAPTTYASVTSSGVLTAATVTANQSVTVSASYTSGGVNRSAIQSVAIVNVTATLSSLSISGPSSVNEGATGTYTATATWSDGSSTGVTPTWSVAPTTYASLTASGVLTAATVTANQSVTVSASYTSGGVNRSATQSVTILDMPDFTLTAPQNVEVAGPVSTSPGKQFRLKWDPVTTRADGTPVPEGSVSYDAYWTTDSTLSAANLQPLAPSSSATTVDFNPNSAGMPRNQRVYFTTKAKNTVGEQSPLAEAVSWVANNEGPAAPKNPRINKK